MTTPKNLTPVIEIMTEFAEETGLTATDCEPRRYLWTDAFAVCNFLELYRRTRENRFKDLALALVNQVHHTLGRHREDDARSGWISGLAEAEGEQHPTRGGLRIGKKRNERKPGDPFDQRSEWDRDGQYYHYLTKWMQALNKVSRETGDETFNRWALELAQAAHVGFTYGDPSGEGKRMHWKMSIDLSYPLVPSMGHHDPLDGYLTYQQLQATRKEMGGGGPDLKSEIADMAAICRGKSWTTDDPLGLGGLLSDACRAGQLITEAGADLNTLLVDILEDAQTGMEAYDRQNHLKLPPEYRLAFRELGLSIGLHGVNKLHDLLNQHTDRFPAEHPARSRVESLSKYQPLTDAIEQFWLTPAHRETATWKDHLDINRVMLATSLAPEGYLDL